MECLDRSQIRFNTSHTEGTGLFLAAFAPALFHLPDRCDKTTGIARSSSFSSSSTCAEPDPLLQCYSQHFQQHRIMCCFLHTSIDTDAPHIADAKDTSVAFQGVMTALQDFVPNACRWTSVCCRGVCLDRTAI